ncbi:hypothetical protein, partial [Mycobacteroides chelonae]|uniref:hypothetical protein n=1 Tax=Mycobacteroides chelonae TaxID=1774 RepID=UPI0009BD1EEF
MNKSGDDLLRLQPLSEDTQQRVDSQLDQLFTNAALSDARAEELISGVFEEVAVPSQRQQTPAVQNETPEDVASWASYETRTPTGDIPATGGGKVYRDPRPAPQAPPRRVDDSVADERSQALWRPPQPPPVEIPDDIDNVAPITAPSEEIVSAIADDDELFNSAAPKEPLLKGLGEAISRWPKWVKVTAPTATALSLIVMLALALSGGEAETPRIAAPESGVNQTPSATPTTKDGPLVPPLDGFQNDCPAGSSEPALAFGADKTQAFVCVRFADMDAGGMTLTFSRPVVVSSLCVVPGFRYVEDNGRDHWGEHRLVTRILCHLGN